MQIVRFSELMGGQLLQAEALQFPIPGSSSIVKVEYLADGGDNKFMWKMNSLSSGLWRSPTSITPMSHFDLVVRSPLLERSRTDSYHALLMIKHWEDTTAAEQKSLASAEGKHRSALCGSLLRTGTPILCETEALRRMSSKATMVSKKLHDTNKNVSQAMHNRPKYGLAARRAHRAGCEQAAKPAEECTCGCPVVELKDGTRGKAKEKVKQLLMLVIMRSALDFGLRGCEWRKVIGAHREVHAPYVTEHTLQMFELHNVYLSVSGVELMGTALWKFAEYAAIGSISVYVEMLASEDELEDKELAELSIFNMLNCSSTMRRRLKLASLSSIHEEDAEGDFAQVKLGVAKTVTRAARPGPRLPGSLCYWHPCSA
jgi:hypothetical protein